MAPIIRFHQVSRSYNLHRDRPRSFREIFVGRRSNQPGRRARKNEVFWALRDVSFAIQGGETVAFIGPNGAGKSTVLKLIGRVLPPVAGTVEVNGRVGALLELGTGFHPDLTGRQNVFLSGALAGMSRAETRLKFDSIVAFSELEEFIDVPVKHYSSGMFARLAFAVSIHLDPEVLLVDEVLAVGDQSFQTRCLDRISALQREGVTICLVTHSPDIVRSICGRAIWLDHGHVMADGAAEAVLRRYLDRAQSAEAVRLAHALAPGSNQRWGSRKIEIVRVRLADALGMETAIFETGQPLVLEMDYRVQGQIPSPVFGMAIHRQDGLHICGPNTAFAGLEFPVLQGQGTMTYCIPHLPLLEGLYEISVAVVNRNDTEIFDYHDRTYRFRVLNGAVKERYGILTVGGKWSHQPAAPDPALHSID